MIPKRGISPSVRIALLVLLDSFLIGISVLSSYFVRYYFDMPPEIWMEVSVYTIVSVIVLGFSFFFYRLYHRVWRYASIGEIVSIIKAVVIGSVIAYLIASLILKHWIPWQAATRTFETTILLVGGSRFIWRIYRDRYSRKRDKKKRRTLVIGAGDCGSMIVKEMRTNPDAEQWPAAFIDDDPMKQRLHVNGVPVVGDRSKIVKAVELLGIDDIIIAIPSASRSTIAEIIEICKQTPAKLKIVPTLSHILEGKVTIQSIRNVEVEDLLGRDPVKVDLRGISEYLEGKTVLVTGAGGSIGSELCRQLLFFRPAQLLLLGHGENSIYTIENELSSRNVHSVDLVPIIADVKDLEQMRGIFAEYRPDVVFHAAAHKHVPLMEQNPAEAIKNNVFGTRNVAECAARYGAERFVLISTDKAVNPTSVMGVTKRIAEMIVQSYNAQSGTRFTAVRFGNVLGSRGSVIPRFKEQIERGGPVTVTHPDMVRYFMTIPEAVQLVIQAGAFTQGGEVFVLDMGKPVKIKDLAEDLIRFSGFEPHVDIKIVYTGIRPGEKLYEELLTEEEGLTSTKHNRIFVGRPPHPNPKQMEFELKRLEQVLNEKPRAIRELLKHIVPTYQYAPKVKEA